MATPQLRGVGIPFLPRHRHMLVTAMQPHEPPADYGGSSRSLLCAGPVLFGAAVGGALGTRARLPRRRLQLKADPDEGYWSEEELSPWDLSEEELAACEIADEDLVMDESEEAEWAVYDEEVSRYRELLAAAEGGSLLDALERMEAKGEGLAGAFESTEASDSSLPDVLESLEVSEDDALSELLLSSSDPPAPTASEPSLVIPACYSECFAEGKGGVIVSQHLGPNTVVLLKVVPDQPDLLLELTRIFSVMRVRILRGWLASTGNESVDAFEVCDADTGAPLPDERQEMLRLILARMVRAPGARQVLAEVQGQVPQLEAFVREAGNGFQPPEIASVEDALAGGPLATTEALDLGRALAFRGTLEQGTPASEALDECRRRVSAIPIAKKEGVAQHKGAMAEAQGEWDCLLCTAASFREDARDVLLFVVPAEDLVAEAEPELDDRLFAAVAACLTLSYYQTPPNALAVSPVACGLVFGTLAVSELVRRVVSSALGVRLSLPCVVPSSTLGSLGTISSCREPVPSRTAMFDVALATLAVAFLLSGALVVLGFTPSSDVAGCSWVNPHLLPSTVGRLLEQRAATWQGSCAEPAPSSEFVAAPTLLVAGALSLTATALNALPIAGLDGAALAVSAPPALEGVLSTGAWALVVLLGALDANAQGLFPPPLAVVFGVVTAVVRPQLAPNQIFRDNVSQPRDGLRALLGALVLLAAFAVLAPTQPPMQPPP